MARELHLVVAQTARASTTVDSTRQMTVGLVASSGQRSELYVLQSRLRLLSRIIARSHVGECRQWAPFPAACSRKYPHAAVAKRSKLRIQARVAATTVNSDDECDQVLSGKARHTSKSVHTSLGNGSYCCQLVLRHRDEFASSSTRCS